MINLPSPPNRTPFTDENGKPGIWMSWFALIEQYFNLLTATGTTAQRPNPAPFVGFMYYDTTIGKPIWASANTPTTTWVKADGTSA